MHIFKIQGGMVHGFHNTRGFGTFLKTGEGLMHDFKNTRGFVRAGTRAARVYIDEVFADLPRVDYLTTIFVLVSIYFIFYIHIICVFLACM